MCVVGLVSVVFSEIVLALVVGAILTFIAVSLPFRVFQNLTQPERRTVRIWETVWCILAFLSLVYVVILAIISRPPDW
jgi:tryptophan-rich sensory protein